MSKFEYIDYFFNIVSACCESSQIKCRDRLIRNYEPQSISIVSIVAFIAVILFVDAAIGVLTPILADAKIGTKHIRLDAIGQGLPDC